MSVSVQQVEQDYLRKYISYCYNDFETSFFVFFIIWWILFLLHSSTFFTQIISEDKHILFGFLFGVVNGSLMMPTTLKGIFCDVQEQLWPHALPVATNNVIVIKLLSYVCFPNKYYKFESLSLIFCSYVLKQLWWLVPALNQTECGWMESKYQLYQ